MAAKFLGQFLLEQGLIDRQQLLGALEAQRNSNPVLGELAQAVGMLDYIQAARINERQRREDRRFGDIAQEMGLLTAAQVDTLLGQQNAGRKLFGDVLVERGALTRSQLADALLAQQHGREGALKALALGIAGHAAGDLMSCAINTCTRLFPRLLKTQCQFSSLVRPGDGLDGSLVTARVQVRAQRPLWTALAADRAVCANFAGAFLSMPPDDCDVALAEDALGELVNVLMGYVVKDSLPEDASYRAEPPDFGATLPALAAEGQVLVSMTSQLGPFVLVIG